MQWHPVAAPEIFFAGGGVSRGAKCNSKGAKIQKFAENGWFWQYFPSDKGASGGGQMGGKFPHAPPLDAATDDIPSILEVG